MNRYRRFSDKTYLNQTLVDQPPYDPQLLHKELVSKLKDKVREMTEVLAQAESLSQSAEFYQKTNDEYLKSLKQENQRLRKTLFENFLSDD